MREPRVGDRVRIVNQNPDIYSYLSKFSGFRIIGIFEINRKNYMVEYNGQETILLHDEEFELLPDIFELWQED